MRLAVPSLALALSLVGCSHDWDAFAVATGAGSGAGGAGGSGGGPAASSSSAGSGGSGSSGPGGAGGVGAQGGGGGLGGSASVGGQGNGGDGGQGGNGPLTVTFAPTVAACVSTTMPDPAECEAATGDGLMNVDLIDPLMLERRSFLRFEIDPQLADDAVDSIVLQLTTGSGSAMGSVQAGEVYRVAPFTLADLNGAVPATQGAALAGSPGAVGVSSTASWTLSNDLLADGGGLIFLGVLPITQDGADYFNDDGATPPALVVTFH